MLFNYEKLDKFDSSEDCLIAKILLGLIFNPFVPANSKTKPKYKLSREFLQYYLDEKVVKNLDFSKAEVLFKPKYSWFNTEKKEVKDRTAPDLLLLFPSDTIIAFEVKYTLPVQTKGNKRLSHQLVREYEGLRFPQNKFEARAKYLLLLITHQRLFQHIKGRRSNKGLEILRMCYEDYGEQFRVNTWNCVYKVVQGIDAKYLPNKKEILDFLEQKENYMTNPLDGTKKKDKIELISFENDNPAVYNWKELKKLVNDGSKVLTQESGTVKGYKTIEEIYNNGKDNGNWWVGRQGGEETIIEDGRTNWKRHKGRYCMNTKKPSRGTKGNWITSKRFAELVDKYGLPPARE